MAAAARCALHVRAAANGAGQPSLSLVAGQQPQGSFSTSTLARRRVATSRDPRADARPLSGRHNWIEPGQTFFLVVLLEGTSRVRAAPINNIVGGSGLMSHL